MEELNCDDCGRHIGWMVDCGPRGEVICESCKQWKDENESEENEEDND